MGTHIQVYTIYGVRSEWDPIFHEAYSKVDEELREQFGFFNPVVNELQIEAVMDSLCSSYMIFGKILYTSGDFRYCDNMNEFQELELSDLENHKTEYLKKFEEMYPFHTCLLDGKEWKLMNLIHYS